MLRQHVTGLGSSRAWQDWALVPHTDDPGGSGIAMNLQHTASSLSACLGLTPSNIPHRHVQGRHQRSARSHPRQFSRTNGGRGGWLAV